MKNELKENINIVEGKLYDYSYTEETKIYTNEKEKKRAEHLERLEGKYTKLDEVYLKSGEEKIILKNLYVSDHLLSLISREDEIDIKLYYTNVINKKIVLLYDINSQLPAFKKAGL
tara:strand:+ start:41290 stop:41637 length:348 start_codon:yes stop_codon:yes gene_type:complete